MSDLKPREVIARSLGVSEQAEARIASGKPQPHDALKVKLGPVIRSFIEAGVESGTFDPELPLFPEDEASP